MKINCLIISAVLLFLFKIASSQDRVEVTVSPKEMSQGTQTAFTVFIPESEPKMVEKQWKKFINERSFFEFATKGTSQTVGKAFLGVSNLFSQDKKSYSKESLKVEKMEDELVVRNVMHEQLTSNNIDVYARITGTENGVYLSSFLKYSDSIFIDKTNATEDAILSIENYIREFGVETYQEIVAEQIKEEEKELREQEGMLKDLERKNKSLHKSIGKNEAEIDEFNYSIVSLAKDLERIDERLTEYKVSLNATSKNAPGYEAINQNLKDKKKERNKNLNKTKSFKRKIKRNEIDIKNANTDILENESEQMAQKEVIEKQELRVQEFENKLANIK